MYPHFPKNTKTIHPFIIWYVILITTKRPEIRAVPNCSMCYDVVFGTRLSRLSVTKARCSGPLSVYEGIAELLVCCMENTWPDTRVIQGFRTRIGTCRICIFWGGAGDRADMVKETCAWGIVDVAWSADGGGFRAGLFWRFRGGLGGGLAVSLPGSVEESADAAVRADRPFLRLPLQSKNNHWGM